MFIAINYYEIFVGSDFLISGRWFLVETLNYEDIVVYEIEDMLNSEDIDS